MGAYLPPYMATLITISRYTLPICNRVGTVLILCH
nr:MAG TPA: hypothetical protein [Caudoviricetes sp.]DAV28311.1 MAG TPA: hypothetical protein [Caudoviricetes sp.]